MFDKLSSNYGTESEAKYQRELDEVIFDILGLTKEERKQVYDALEEALNLRIKRREKKVLVN